MSSWKQTIKDWTPPVMLQWGERLLHRTTAFSGPYDSWTTAQSNSTGYDAELILAKVLEATLKVTKGEAAFERDSVLFDKPEYEWPVLLGLMWGAARNGGRLSVLDFGGALGSCYFQSRDFLQGLPATTWSVVEQAHYVQCGQAHIQNEVLRFYSTISACATEQSPNVVLLSSVLQYLEKPHAILDELSHIGADLLIVDRTIFNTGASDVIYVQHVPDAIYKASYPVRSFSEETLINAIGNGYRLVSDFQSLTFPGLAAINSHFKGYVFQKSGNP